MSSLSKHNLTRSASILSENQISQDKMFSFVRKKLSKSSKPEKHDHGSKCSLNSESSHRDSICSLPKSSSSSMILQTDSPRVERSSSDVSRAKFGYRANIKFTKAVVRGSKSSK